MLTVGSKLLQAHYRCCLNFESQCSSDIQSTLGNAESPELNIISMQFRFTHALFASPAVPMLLQAFLGFRLFKCSGSSAGLLLGVVINIGCPVQQTRYQRACVLQFPGTNFVPSSFAVSSLRRLLAADGLCVTLSIFASRVCMYMHCPSILEVCITTGVTLWDGL